MIVVPPGGETMLIDRRLSDQGRPGHESDRRGGPGAGDQGIRLHSGHALRRGPCRQHPAVGRADTRAHLRGSRRDSPYGERAEPDDDLRTLCQSHRRPETDDRQTWRCHPVERRADHRSDGRGRSTCEPSPWCRAGQSAGGGREARADRHRRQRRFGRPAVPVRQIPDARSRGPAPDESSGKLMAPRNLIGTVDLFHGESPRFQGLQLRPARSLRPPESGHHE